jgi:hypothetical protein
MVEFALRSKRSDNGNPDLRREDDLTDGRD